MSWRVRFKADESSQTIAGRYRQLRPEDNNERQAIHKHVSVPLPESTLRRISKMTGEGDRRPKNHVHVGTGVHARSVERSSTYASMKSTVREVK